MKAELKTITPAIAAKMLESNTNNRTLSPHHVEQLSKELTSGRWKINGDMIRVSATGRILDGQHRLSAIVKTGLSIQSWVMTGLPDDIFDTIDVGRKRSHADTLGCRGELNTSRLSSALILIDQYMTGRVSKNPIYSNGEIEELLEKYPEARKAIKTLVGNKKLIQPSVIDACRFLFSQKDPELADTFFDRVMRGADLAPGSPEFVLREKLVNNSLSKAKLSRDYIFALCIKTWNHLRNGTAPKILKFATDGPASETFPIVQ